MTLWELFLEAFKIGTLLLSEMIALFVISFGIKNSYPKIKAHIRKQIRNWYRNQRRAEQKNRVKNAKVIERWCRENYYGEL